jgi:hypothetical protein
VKNDTSLLPHAPQELLHKACFYHIGYAEMEIGEVVGWTFSPIAGAIVMTWLYNSARGSLLLLSLFPTALNIAFTSEAARGNWANILGAWFMAAAVRIVWSAGPQRLSRTHSEPKEAGNGYNRKE